MEEKQKIYLDKEKLIELELERTKKALSENLDKLPNEELPFMENHLRALYFQTYFLLAYGFYNASIVLCGIFLESIAKERLFNEGIKDEKLEEMRFNDVIVECKKRKILSSEEINFLRNKKDEIRNPYQHYNKIKLTKGRYFDVYKIFNPVEKLIELDKKVKSSEITEQEARKNLIKGLKPEQMDSTMLRPLAQIVKGQEDEYKAFDIFLEVDNFTRTFAKKYFEQGHKTNTKIDI